MKKLLVFYLAVGLLICKSSGAQQQLDIKKFKIEYLDLPLAQGEIITQPISNFEILDARPDNFCLGFVKGKQHKEKTSNYLIYYDIPLVLTGKLEQAIQQVLISAVKSETKTGFELLVVVKELWLYDSGTELTGENIDILTNVNKCELLFRSDIYVRRNEDYIPLLKIDTTFSIKNTLAKSINELFKQTFTNLFKKINYCPVSTVFNNATRVKSRISIDSFYNRSITLKSLIGLDTSKQYIFKTFEDFKNGSRRISTMYKISDKKGSYYYEKNKDGTEYLMQDYAFIDKGVLYIKINSGYSPVFINNSRLYSLGSKFFSSRIHSIPFVIPGPFALLGGTVSWDSNTNRGLQNLMFDMPTGNTY